jgi:glycosyltransferase involved in cell wall biosynthesis
VTKEINEIWDLCLVRNLKNLDRVRRNMKAVCISCFNHYENRIKHIEKFLNNKGYDIKYITSDFDHIKKMRYISERSNEICIRTLPYYKNLSFRRLLSHYFFSKKAITELKRIKPDLLYIIIPPNSLVKFASKYKQRNNVKLIYDLYDLWPETFPCGKAKKILSLPFKLWGNFRNNYLSLADVVITECKLYQKKLKPCLKNMKTNTLYLTKEASKFDAAQDVNFIIDEESINICYLGSINNIIDIALITKLLSAINKYKPVMLYIIGDGENRKQFICALQRINIKVIFLGKIFDEEKKRAIFEKCSFGLNMMKKTVCVGLTLKSIDYFQAGIPVLNNIKADTEIIVEQYDIGFNVNDDNFEEVAVKVANINLDELLAMKNRTRQVFNKLFSLAEFNKNLGVILKDVIK